MATEQEVNELAKRLRNVGPKLAAKLVEAGIDTPEKLRQIGAKRAFEKMYPAGDAYGDFNAAYLYALEGAIRDCDWLDIPEKIKQEYKEYAQNLPTACQPSTRQLSSSL
jgi:DNA transformation protein